MSGQNWYGQDRPNGSAVEDEEDDRHHEHSVHRRLRANSSIMQAKKILGMSVSESYSVRGRIGSTSMAIHQNYGGVS